MSKCDHCDFEAAPATARSSLLKCCELGCEKLICTVCAQDDDKLCVECEMPLCRDHGEFDCCKACDGDAEAEDDDEEEGDLDADDDGLDDEPEEEPADEDEIIPNPLKRGKAKR